MEFPLTAPTYGKSQNWQKSTAGKRNTPPPAKNKRRPCLPVLPRAPAAEARCSNSSTITASLVTLKCFLSSDHTSTGLAPCWKCPTGTTHFGSCPMLNGLLVVGDAETDNHQTPLAKQKPQLSSHCSACSSGLSSCMSCPSIPNFHGVNMLCLDEIPYHSWGHTGQSIPTGSGFCLATVQPVFGIQCCLAPGVGLGNQI